jgi:hypothetical protein
MTPFHRKAACMNGGIAPGLVLHGITGQEGAELKIEQDGAGWKQTTTAFKHYEGAPLSPYVQMAEGLGSALGEDSSCCLDLSMCGSGGTVGWGGTRSLQATRTKGRTRHTLSRLMFMEPGWMPIFFLTRAFSPWLSHDGLTGTCFRLFSIDPSLYRRTLLLSPLTNAPASCLLLL